MDSTERVRLQSYPSEVEAELAAAVLRANGIACETMLDQSHRGYGVQAGAHILVIEARDRDRARHLLDTPAR